MAIPRKPAYNPGTRRRVPAVQSPTNPVTKPASSRSFGKSVGVVMASIGGLALVLGLWGIPLIIKRFNDNNYTPSSIEVPVIREATKTIRPTIDLDKTFSPENMKAMESGKGLIVTLVTTVHDKEIARRTLLTLKPWDHYEATSNPERRRDIADIKERLTNMIKNFEIHQTWVIDFVLDDTDGVTDLLTEKAKSIFDKLELDERIRIGDGVDISFIRLSNNDYLQRDNIVVPSQTAEVSKYLNQINIGFKKLLAKRAGRNESSVARGLLNALNANSGRENREIIIISDGLENSQLTGVSFYGKEGLKQLDPSNWDKLDQNFLSGIQQPQLAGSTVSWFAPPSAESHSKEVQLSFKYWEHLLGPEKLGAIDVKTHFGV
jgi:hypothetical protein